MATKRAEQASGPFTGQMMTVCASRMAVFIALVLQLCGPFSSLPLQAADSIKVASIYAHSGLAAQSNIHSIKGVREAVREINTMGGVLKRRLELVELDNRSSPIGSKVAAEKAADLGVIAIIGADWSSHTLAIAPVAQARKIPLITNISTHEQITRAGDYIFRVCYTDSQQGRAVASFARDGLKADTAVMLVDLTSDYSLSLSNEFKSQFEALGGKIVLRLAYTMKDIDPSSLAARAGMSKADVVFIPGYEESAVILKHIMNAGFRITPLGGDGWGSEQFYEKGGKDLPFGFYAGHWSEEIDSDTSRAFVKKYKKESVAGMDAEALAFDAVFLLADAVKRARSTDRAKVRDALAATKNYPGVTGPITFDARGNPLKGVVIMRIQAGVPHYYRTMVVQ